MTPTSEEIEALASLLDNFAEMPVEGGSADPLIEVLNSIGHQAAAMLRAIDAERRELLREVEIIKTETPEGYVTNELLQEVIGQLATAKNNALEEAAAACVATGETIMSPQGCATSRICASAIRVLMTQEAT